MTEQDTGLFEAIKILEFVKGQCFVVQYFGVHFPWRAKGQISISTDLKKAKK